MTDTPEPLSAKRLSYLAAVTDGHRRAGYDRVLLHLGEVDALIAEVKRLRAEGEWQPIDGAPPDDSLIQRWHVAIGPVTVFRNNGKRPGYDWIAATKDNSWPESAFTPHYRRLPSPPSS